MGIKNMFMTLKNTSCPVGVDMGEEMLKLVQLYPNGDNIQVLSGISKMCPSDIKQGSAQWQHWCVEVFKSIISENGFKNKEVVAALPAREVFVDTVKVEKVNKEDNNVEEVAFKKVKQRLPFETDDAVVKFIPTEENNVVVIATERKKIDRYLAIFEHVNLKVQSLGVWPLALINTYVRFFGRRQSDFEAVVILVEIEQSCTNVVINRHKNLLFARSIPIGSSQFGVEEMLNRLVLELEQCKRQFRSLYRKAHIERMIFLSGQNIPKEAYTKIAKQMELSAQIGDCVAAVELKDPSQPGIERRKCTINWSTAFGLSLS